MKIAITFKLKKSEFPKDYRPVMVSVLKNVLNNYNEDLVKEYYNEQDPIMKSFTFSVFLPKPSFSEETIFLNGDTINLNISTPNIKDAMLLYSAMVESKTNVFPLPNQNEMKVTKILLPKFSEIKTNEIIIKMLSPLLVRDHDVKTNKDYYLDYTSEKFSEKLKEIIKWQVANYQSIRNLSKLFEQFSIQPVIPKKTVVKSFKQSFNANLGMYKLTGHPALLNFLYLSGIGSRRNQGFGAFEILV